MKKLLFVMLAIVLVISLVACDNKDYKELQTTTDDTTTNAPSTPDEVVTNAPASVTTPDEVVTNAPAEVTTVDQNQEQQTNANAGVGAYDELFAEYGENEITPEDFLAIMQAKVDYSDLDLLEGAHNITIDFVITATQRNVELSFPSQLSFSMIDGETFQIDMSLIEMYDIALTYVNNNIYFVFTDTTSEDGAVTVARRIPMSPDDIEEIAVFIQEIIAGLENGDIDSPVSPEESEAMLEMITALQAQLKTIFAEYDDEELFDSISLGFSNDRNELTFNFDGFNENVDDLISDVLELIVENFSPSDAPENDNSDMVAITSSPMDMFMMIFNTISIDAEKVSASITIDENGHVIACESVMAILFDHSETAQSNSVAGMSVSLTTTVTITHNGEFTITAPEGAENFTVTTWQELFPNDNSNNDNQIPSDSLNPVA